MVDVASVNEVGTLVLYKLTDQRRHPPSDHPFERICVAGRNILLSPRQNGPSAGRVWKVDVAYPPFLSRTVDPHGTVYSCVQLYTVPFYLDRGWQSTSRIRTTPGRPHSLSPAKHQG